MTIEESTSSVATPPPLVATGEESSSTYRGRTRIKRAALHALFRAITADVCGVAPRDVTAELADQNGRLNVGLTVRLSVTSLNEPQRPAEESTNLIEFLRNAQRDIHERATALSQSSIAQISLRLGRATIEHAGRVK